MAVESRNGNRRKTFVVPNAPLPLFNLESIAFSETKKAYRDGPKEIGRCI
jgi:hypothetical protein